MREQIKMKWKRVLFVLLTLFLANASILGELIRSKKGTFQEVFLSDVDTENIEYIEIGKDRKEVLLSKEDGEMALLLEYISGISLRTKIPNYTKADRNRINIYISYNDSESIWILFCNDSLVSISKGRDTKNYILKEPFDFEYLMSFMD